MRISLLILLFCSSINAQYQTLFQSGDLGYECFRIPAMVGSDSKLYAFAEGRKGGCGDFGDVDILLRTSSDGGESWTEPQVIVDNANLQAGNPTPVIDILNPEYPEGRLMLFYNTGTQSEWETRSGNGRRKAFYKFSSDFGMSWSEPIDISNEVHFDRFSSVEFADARTFALGPGHAIQLATGSKKGRIYLPANHSLGDPQENFADYRSYGIYSDDFGKSWKVSEDLPIPSSNEAMAVELPGELLLLIRMQNNKDRSKMIARSLDNGASWNQYHLVPELTSPVCQSSIIYIPESDHLYHLGPASIEKREGLTLWRSTDRGRGWKALEIVESGFAAYSDVIQLSDTELGVLYESEDYDRIVFKRIEVYLTD